MKVGLGNRHKDDYTTLKGGKMETFMKGHRCINATEMPRGMAQARGKTIVRHLSHLLPATLPSGYDLTEVEPSLGYGADPVILTDRFGRIIYQWEEGEIPLWLDVANVCNQLGLT